MTVESSLKVGRVCDGSVCGELLPRGSKVNASNVTTTDVVMMADSCSCFILLQDDFPDSVCAEGTVINLICFINEVPTAN